MADSLMDSSSLSTHRDLSKESPIYSPATLPEPMDQTMSFQAEGRRDEDAVRIIEEQSAKAIEAVTAICDHLKHQLVQDIRVKATSDMSHSTAHGAYRSIDPKYQPEQLLKNIQDLLPSLLMEYVNKVGRVSSLLTNLEMSVRKATLGVPDYSSAVFQNIYGSGGYGAGQLTLPFGICISPVTRQLIIADWFHHRIQIVSDELQPIVTFGNDGNGNNEYKYPVGVTVNSKGNLFITDSGNHRVQVTSPEGLYLGEFGSRGSGQGEYDSPRGIACDEDDLLYICDSENHRIAVVNEQGEHIKFIGCKGENPGQFRYTPFTIACSKALDKMIITDFDGGIHFFTYNGQFLKTIYSNQAPYNMWARCTAIDHCGNVLVGDDGSHRLVVLSPDLQILATVGGSGRFNFPRGIAVTSDGRLYVSDSNNHRIHLLKVPIIKP